MDPEKNSQSQSPEKPTAAPPPRSAPQTFFSVLAVVIFVLVLAALIVPNLMSRKEKGQEKASGTCEKMSFEERGVGMRVGEYVTCVAW